MHSFIYENRRWLAWVVPSLLFLLIIGLESNWGRVFFPAPKLPPESAARPVSMALAPEYQLPGGVDAYSETVNRPLLAPGRRQAPPPAPPAPPKPAIVRGQFALMGTTVTTEKTVALLRELSSGKFMRVTKGEVINGMTVDKIEPSKVTLRLADDTDEVPLKIALGPKVPLPPPGMPQAGIPPAGIPQAGMPQAGIPPSGILPGASTPPGVVSAGQLLQGQAAQSQALIEERRRAARAADRSGQPAPVAPVVNPPPNQPPGQQPNQTTDWNTVFQRMMQQKK